MYLKILEIILLNVILEIVDLRGRKQSGQGEDC